MLRTLGIHNYKSLRAVKLDDIPNFSVLVGANASGKSNFADALDFLSLVFRGGLAYAVRIKGGYENICFRRARRSKAGLQFEVVAEASPPSAYRTHGRKSRKLLRYEYTFGFRARTRKIVADYSITSERLRVTDLKGKLMMEVERKPDGVSLQQSKAGEKLLGLPGSDWFQRYVTDVPIPEDELIVGSTLRSLFFGGLADLLQGCRVYQISPHMARETGVPERSPELGRHGENLPAAVDYLKRKRPDAFEELLAHLRNTVPAMQKLETRYVETKQLGLFFEERGVGRSWFSQDVSDGTLQTLSIFLPLLDHRIKVAVVEEPENSVHPWILRHFIETCRMHSKIKQIFITTHSLVALNDVPVTSLYVVARTEGVTTIEKATKLHPEAVQVAREQLLGLGDYWDSGGLGGTPEPDLSG